jgi:hypothetical protein
LDAMLLLFHGRHGVCLDMKLSGEQKGRFQRWESQWSK